jgi:hypothetical protein
MTAERMEYRQFGKTDLKTSAIGFGRWEIGGIYGRIDESEFRRAVAQAIDSGITPLRGARVVNPSNYLGTEGREIHADPRQLPLRQHFLRAELVAGSDRNSGPRLQSFVLH